MYCVASRRLVLLQLLVKHGILRQTRIAPKCIHPSIRNLRPSARKRSTCYIIEPTVNLGLGALGMQVRDVAASYLM